jgi:hypothetical protein
MVRLRRGGGEGEGRGVEAVGAEAVDEKAEVGRTRTRGGERAGFGVASGVEDGVGHGAGVAAGLGFGAAGLRRGFGGGVGAGGGRRGRSAGRTRAGRTRAPLWRGATAVPPRAANAGAACGSLATDRRAPHVGDFPISENLTNHFSAQEK